MALLALALAAALVTPGSSFTGDEASAPSALGLHHTAHAEAHGATPPPLADDPTAPFQRGLTPLQRGTITLSVDAATIPTDGAWVTVSYAGVPAEAVPTAFTAIYSPANADVRPVLAGQTARAPYTRTAAVKWRWLNDTDITPQAKAATVAPAVAGGEAHASGLTVSGAERYWVDLAHMRFPTARVYLMLTNGTNAPVVQSFVDLAFEAAGGNASLTPIHGHLALHGDGPVGSTKPWRIVWATLANYPAGVKHGVRWGTQPDALSHFSPTEEDWTIRWGNQCEPRTPWHCSTPNQTDDQFCGSIAGPGGQGWREPGWYHSALFDFSSLDLSVPVKIYYNYGSDAQPSAVASAVVPASAGGSTMLMVADVGTGDVDGSRGGGWQEGSREVHVGAYPGASTVMTNVAQRHAELHAAGVPSMSVHIGDISYAEGYDLMWALFMRMIEPSALMGPYAVIQGNHERDWPRSDGLYMTGDSWGECGVAVAQRFPLPNGTRSTHVDYYAFTNGALRYVLVNSVRRQRDRETERQRDRENALSALPFISQLLNTDKPSWHRSLTQPTAPGSTHGSSAS